MIIFSGSFQNYEYDRSFYGFMVRIHSNQASFREINQLTFLYNTFCKAVDKEVRAVFCDISKAFDRVWSDGLIYKLSAACVTGEALAWYKSFLSNRRQSFFVFFFFFFLCVCVCVCVCVCFIQFYVLSAHMRRANQ